jgi:tRNA threonylcarbamoyladenosine biosynthesis protein TsaE
MPIFDSNMVEFLSRSPEQTRRLGMRLGALFKPGDLFCLHGDLGTGKTTLVQGVARGWGSLDAVTSPTFVIVNVYRRTDGFCLYHLDAFRLSDAIEAEDLDLNLMLEQGAMVVEWPEKIVGALPRECLWADLNTKDEEQRGMIFIPRGEHYIQLLKEFRRQVFGD